MQYIKVYHQDGLIYFDRFRVAELMLIKVENAKNSYQLIIDIQSFDYKHSDDEIKELEQRFNIKINNELDYVWVTLEEITLNAVDELNDLTITAEASEGKFLYFGWHIPLFDNLIKFSKGLTNYNLSWTAMSNDVNYYDEQAKGNKVEIDCELNLLVFDNNEEYQKHEKLKILQRDNYFSILDSLAADAIQVQNTFDISGILSQNLTKLKQNELAWKLAIEQTIQ